MFGAFSYGQGYYGAGPLGGSNPIILSGPEDIVTAIGSIRRVVTATATIVRALTVKLER